MRDLHKVSEFTRRRKKRNQRRALLVCVAVLVALSTVYSLVLPAITMEAQSASCGLDEHTHTSDCYTLTCEKVERFSHTHTDDCYTGGVLTCTLTEQTLHHHSNACYSQPTPTCGLTECEAHTHTEECYTDGTLTCTLAETAGHTHTSDCYPADFTAELICGQEDLPEHRHTDDCYTLTCELTGHTHTEECYSTAEAYALSLTEGAEEATEETVEETTEQASEEETEDTAEETTEQDSEETNELTTEETTDETTEPATEEATEVATAETTGEATETTAEEATEAPTGESDLYTQLMSAASCEELDELFMANETASYALTADQLSAVQAYAQTLPDDGYLADVQDTLDALTEILEACTCGATDGRHTEDCPAYELISGETMLIDDTTENDLSSHQSDVKVDMPVDYDAATKTFKTTFRAKFSFEKSDIVNNGLVWSYTLPDEIVPLTSLLNKDISFTDNNSTYAGTYRFVQNTDGTYKIVITFDQSYIDSANNTISGSYNFSAQIGEDKYQEKKIELHKDGNVIFTIPEDKINWKDGNSINYDVDTKKSSGTVTNDTLSYTVTVSSTKGTPDLTLTDTVKTAEDSSLSIDKVKSVTVKKTDRDNSYATSSITMTEVSSESELTSTAASGTYYFDSTTGKTIYKLPALGKNQYYTVDYTYSYSGVDAGVSTTATNSISATGKDTTKGETVTDTAEVNTDIDKTLTSAKTGSYDSATKSITWTITLNKNNISLNGYVLTDEMFSSANSLTVTSSSGSTTGYTISRDSDGKYSNVTFGDTTDTYTITYTTPVTSTSATAKTIYNSANLTKGNDSTNIGPVGVQVGGASASKSMQGATVSSDGKTATVNWQVTIYVNGTGLASGTTITDSFSNTYQYMTGTQLSNFWGQSNGTGIVAYDSNGNEIKTYKYNSNDNIFNVSFVTTEGNELTSYSGKDMHSNNYKSFSFTLNKEMTFDTNVAYLRMNYSTTVDLSNATAGANYYTNYIGGSFNASATYTYYKRGVKKTDGKGNTTDTTTSNSSGELTWNIEVYVDDEGYPSITVIDTLPTGRDTDGEEVAITLTSLSAWGQYGSCTLNYGGSSGTQTANSNAYTFTGVYNSTTNQIELTVSPQDSTAKMPAGVMNLTVTCKVDGADTAEKGYTVTGLTNSVEVKGNNESFGTDSQTQTWEKEEETSGNNTLSKTSIANTDEQRIYYELVLNPEGADLSEDSDTITLTDTLTFKTHPTDKITLDMNLEANSMKLYYATYDSSSGSYVCGEAVPSANWSWTLDETNGYSGDVFCTITAQVPDATPLILKYSYEVDYTWSGTEDENEKNTYNHLYGLSNSATLTGGGSASDNSNEGKSWEEAKSSLDIMTSYTFNKVNVNNYGDKLEGAEFTLYKYDTSVGDYVKDTVFTTDENGVIQIYYQRDETLYPNDYKYTKNTAYKLKETAAPSGYILPSSPTEFYFYFSSEDTTTYPEAYPNTSFTSTAKDLTDKSGTETITNIEQYSYTLKKVDSSGGKLLNGAVFTLYKYNSKTSKYETTNITYTTGAAGEDGVFIVQWQSSSTDYQFVENTAYYLVETTAPTGYDLPTTETRYYFWFYDENIKTTNIPSYGFDTTTVPNLFSSSVTINASNAKQKTYTLTKYDGTTNDPLKGAVYGVYKYNGEYQDPTLLGTYTTDENGQVQVTVVSSTGTITFDDGTTAALSEYNAYYLAEISAPDGYITDSSTKYYFYYGTAPDSNLPTDWSTVSPQPVNLQKTSGTATAYNNKTSITVSKSWANDDETSRPSSITVKLYQKESENASDFAGSSGGSGSSNASVQVIAEYWTGGTAVLNETKSYPVGSELTLTFVSTEEPEVRSYAPGKNYNWDYTSLTVTSLGNNTYTCTYTVSSDIVIEATKVYTSASVTTSSGGSSSDSGVGTGGTPYTTGDNSTGTYTITPDEDGNWTLTIDNLPYGYTDSEGTYHYYGYFVVEEDTVSGYTTTYENDTGISSGTITVTNTGDGSKSTTTSLSVSKVWQDADGSETTALAESVTIVLHQVDSVESTDIVKETITLNASNSWTWSSSTLPATVTDSGGNKTHDYTYYVVETVPEGATYTPSYTVNNTAGTGTSTDATASGSITVTNRSTVKTTTLKVSKTWAYDVVPDNVTELSFTLYKMTYKDDPSGTGATLEKTSDLLGSSHDSDRSVVSTYTITRHTDGTWYWSSTEENLTLYSYENGNYYTYFIVETSSDAYTTTYSPETEVIGGSTASDITVTNTVKPETTTISVNKTWNGTATTDSVNFKLFQKEWSTKPETTDLQAHSDVAYTDTTYPTGITLVTTGTLTASGEWKWDSSTGYTDTLYSYKDGKYYTYFIVEETSSSYTASYGKEVTSGTITVTNTPNTATTSLTVTKTWVGEELAESIRFKLYKVNLGTDSTATHKYSDGYQFDSTLPSDVTFVQEYTITKTDGTWPTTTIDNLTSFDGTNYYYYIVVEELDSSSTYSATYTHNGNAVTISNKANNTTTSLSVEKKWLDKDGNETNAPTGVDSITFTLYKRAVTTTSGVAGTPVITSENIIITKNADGTWPTWSSSTLDLKKTNADGSITTYTYYIEEVTTGDFTTTYDRNDTTNGVSDGTITIKNTVNETTTLTVNKTWANNVELDGVTSISFDLYKADWGTTKPSAETSYTDLPTTVTTTKVNTTSYTISKENGTWSTWSSSDANLTLDSYKDGHYYTYYVIEASGTNYTATYGRASADTGDTITITNTVGAKTTSLSVTKKWAGIGELDDVPSISFQLYKLNVGSTEPTAEQRKSYDGLTTLPDGAEAVNSTVTITKTDGSWPTWNSGDLQYYDGTNYYVYFIVEDTSSGKFTATYARTTGATGTAGDSIELTNTTKDTTTELSVEKKWLVSDGTTDITLTSGSISFYLKQVAVTTANGVSGEPVESNVKNGELEYFTINPDSNGSWTWNSKTAGLTLDLKKANSDGSVTSYSYYVVELEAAEGTIPSYDLSSTTYKSGDADVSSTATVTSGTVTITNTLKPIETELSVTKTWAGVGELDDVTSVTFTLYQKTWNSAPANVGTDIPEGATKVTKDDGTDYTIPITKDTTTNTWPMWSSTSDNSLKLYSYKDGEYYTYYVVEDTSSGKFTATYGRSTGASGDTITVTNTTKEKDTELSVSKVWQDSNGSTIDYYTGIDSVTFTITQTATAADGTVTSITLMDTNGDDRVFQLSTEANGTTSAWTWSSATEGLTLPLQTYENGTLTTYSYSIKEVIDSTETRFTLVSSTTTQGTDGKLTGTLTNKLTPTEYTLPMTGGSGTTPFYILGSVLTLGAFLLLNKKRYPRAKGR